jgi:hypothetical protein
MNQNQPTKAELNAGMQILIAVGQAIRELKTVPAGPLYARLMGKMDLEQFDAMIAILVKQGLVERTSDHQIKWIAG